MTTSMPHVDQEAGRPPHLLVDTPDDASRWAAEHRDWLRTFVAEHGALLVRGLELTDPVRAEAVFRQVGELRTETEAFAPRSRYAEGVYSATEWPPNQPMCLHHELSYALQPPGLMLFACLVAPEGDGATLVADASAVLDALPNELVDRCERLGWLVIRNYGEDIGASLQESFGTDDRDAIERYCRANAIQFEWGADDGSILRTRQRRQAVVRHPLTGRRCWFNQIAFLSEWTLAPELREYILDVYGANGLPFNTRFGNGDPVDADVVQAINDTYERHTARQPWQAGDLLLVDNVRSAHGREPFEGPREVVVALSGAVHMGD